MSPFLSFLSCLFLSLLPPAVSVFLVISCFALPVLLSPVSVCLSPFLLTHCCCCKGNCLFCIYAEVPPTSYLSARTSSFAFPLLPAAGLKGSLLYFDGQMNDSRLCLSLALSPTVPGFVDGMQPAAAANHLAARQLIKDENGQIVKRRHFYTHRRHLSHLTLQHIHATYTDMQEELNNKQRLSPVSSKHLPQ